MVGGKIERQAGRRIDHGQIYENNRKRYRKERLQVSESSSAVDGEE